MKLARMICILAVALATLLTVVVLRAESTHLHFELARLDRKASILWQQIREDELELARLRNPVRIRQRALELSAGRGWAPSAVAERTSGP
ncbi:MAG: hypothetical protein IH986_05830 [Planctomycetes bacterium]|nr:hypothetical protein [Planctomycetota bacterium]